MIQRAYSVFAAILAALVLTGCFVVSTNLPAGSGPVADERLVGAWQGFDADDGEPAEAYLHFLKPKSETAPLTLVWVEDPNFQIYEVRTMVVGGKNVFAAKLLSSSNNGGDELPAGWYLGFYEVKNGEVVFNLLDAEKIGDLIAKGRLKGTRPPGKWEVATLTGSPEELAKFLASPEAQAAQMDDPAVIRRLR